MTRRAVGVVICGMGRSGTSAVTGLFASSGYHVARDGDRMGANAANPVGYHENLRVWRLNERILDALDATWYAPPPEKRQAAARSRFVPEIEREFTALLAEAGSAPLALKDPRIDVLVPLWGPVIDASLHPVLVIRDPIEIARSLERRDGTPMPFGLAAWEIHMASALRWLRGREVTVARYENLLGSAGAPADLVADVNDHLDPSYAESLVVSDGGAWLDAALRHYCARPDDHAELVTARQAQLWEWLRSLKDETRVLSPPEELTVASGSAHAAVAQEQLRARLAHEMVVQVQELSTLAVRLNELESRVRSAEQEHARLSSTLEVERADAVARERHVRVELEVVLRSRSWRLTGPLRSAARRARPGVGQQSVSG